LLRGRGLATLLLFLYVTEEAGRKYVLDMPWPPAAECNMITNKQTGSQAGTTPVPEWKKNLRTESRRGLDELLLHIGTE